MESEIHEQTAVGAEAGAPVPPVKGAAKKAGSRKKAPAKSAKAAPRGKSSKAETAPGITWLRW